MNRTRLWLVAVLIGALPALAVGAAQGPTHGSITDTSVRWPGWDELARVLTLRDHNTRVVVLGTTLLGLAAGMIGTFMLLRKRALMGDALSHATLPGIGIAFIVMVAMGGTGKYLPGLLLGAALSGAVGVGCVLLIRTLTRIKEDAALAIVLSVFFGIGVSILGIIQKMDTGHAAGLQSFIYGKTASMLTSDAKLIGVVAVMVAIFCALLFKEFAAICFDQEYAGSQGWPVLWLDVVMLSLLIIVTVVGLQAVGLILMIAMLVIPPAAARFWTNHLPTMVLFSAAIGAVSGMVGVGLSALIPRLPAGAIIVLAAACLFAISFVFGSARGLLVRIADHLRVSRKVGNQDLLRALFEWREPALVASAEEFPVNRLSTAMPFERLLSARSWSARRVRRLLARAHKRGLVQSDGDRGYALTAVGFSAARRVVRNHRLWKLYLINYADVAPNHVDRDADQLEHVLGDTIVRKLGALLAAEHPHLVDTPGRHPPGLAGGATPAAAGS